MVKTQLRSKLSVEKFNQDYACTCADFGIFPKHAILINVNEKNIPNENPTKEKQYNLISMNLQGKVAHVLANESVKYNVRVIFHRLYSSQLFYSGFYTISENISNAFHSRAFVEFFL